MLKYQGISAAPGIAMGEAFLYLESTAEIPKYHINHHEIDSEIERYQRAVKRAADEINAIKEELDEEATEQHRVLDAHLLMLYDPVFTDQIFDHIKNVLKNVEWVLSDQIKDLVDRLTASQDSYLQERSADLHDVSRRVIDHLMYKKKDSLEKITREAVVVTSDLRPSDALHMNKGLIKGIVMDEGGKTSHTAIIARSFGIPAVLGLGDITKKVRAYDQIIVDGYKGVVIINPDENTSAEYKRELKAHKRREKILKQLQRLPAETTDGHIIKLMANIEIPEEVDQVVTYRADGVGLFRSEFLFMDPDIVPSEAIQYVAYCKVLETMGDKPVTIRTLDVGGDKLIADVELTKEKNPLLGWRAIRFCLDRKKLFKTQLRALLRASVYGNLRIMFPFITSLEEFRQARSIFEEVQAELKKEKIQFNEKIPLGIMIEVPSAALSSDILAEHVDFFSIGTNDLIQYTLAVDRGNERVASLYTPFHPAILRLIKMVVDNAHKAGIPVGMCGEMAGSAEASALLAAIGLDELSMSCYSLPEVKNIIRSISVFEADQLLQEVSSLPTAREVERCVQAWMEKLNDRTK